MPRTSTVMRLLHNKFVIALLAIIVALVVVRAILPTLLTDFVNRKLNQIIPGYEGSIVDVDLSLWRGAYVIHGIDIRKIEQKKPVPLFNAESVDFSVEWSELIRGALVGQIELKNPKINIVAGPAWPEDQKSIDAIVARIRELLPLRINRFAMVDGEIHFRNYVADPDIDIYLHDIDLVARNLTNSAKISDSLVATAIGEGRAMKSGVFKIDMKMDPVADRPTFDLAFELRHFNLPEVNDFLKHYLAVEARDGKLSLDAEAKSREGKYKGYVKPLVKDLDILRIKEEKKSVGEAIKGFFVKIVAAVFENKSKEQLGAKIDFAGSFEDQDITLWGAVGSFLRNAFVQALKPGLEGGLGPRLGGAGSSSKEDKTKQQKEEQRTEKEQEKLERKK